MTGDGGELIVGEKRITVTISRSKRRRRTLAFSMKGPDILHIMAPQRASLESIQRILPRHIGWIRRRMDEFRRHAGRPTAPRAALTYLGRALPIQVVEGAGQGVRLTAHGARVMLSEPGMAPADRVAEIRTELSLLLKKRARTLFKRRLDLWAGRLGVSYRSLKVTEAEQRWGSCNVRNDIRLNWRLIMAPISTLDYVVVHELCHVRNKNHGIRFWAQVASVMPDYKARRQYLRLIGDSLVLCCDNA